MIRTTKLFEFQQASGLLIIAAIVLGLLAANSTVSEVYWAVHHAPVHAGIGPYAIEKPLIKWINEGLMVFFFLLVGLEIKREILEGHLATPKQVALPAFAALGGMVLPAVIYVAFNWNDPTTIQGWAIPTATDIVLAIGILSLLGSRVPVGLKVFLTAVAIFDDIGAVLIIGLFYGDDISSVPLLFSIGALVGLFLLNAFTVTHTWLYVVIGLALWVAMLKAGVEAALAGVLIALAVPIRARENLQASPLRITEQRLHPWVILAIVPLFAFLNAGITIDADASTSFLEPVSLGILFGLLIGKQLGVVGASLMAVRLGLGRLPTDVTWIQVYGAALLAGVGFTMSSFVATLAFTDAAIIASAKAAVLIASHLAAVSGLAVIFAATMNRSHAAAPDSNASKEQW